MKRSLSLSGQKLSPARPTTSPDTLLGIIAADLLPMAHRAVSRQMLIRAAQRWACNLKVKAVPDFHRRYFARPQVDGKPLTRFTIAPAFTALVFVAVYRWLTGAWR